MNTTTLLIAGVAAVAGWYFLVKKPADDKAAASSAAAAAAAGGTLPGAPPGSGLTETQAVLGGTADIITASGTVLGNMAQYIWPN